MVLAMGVAAPYKGSTTLWMLVKRTIAGTDTVSVEYIDDLFVDHDNISVSNTNPYISSGNYLDCAWSCTPAATVPTKLWTVDTGAVVPRFDSETLSVFADGNYVGEVTLGSDDNGAFTLTRPASQVTVGYKYPGVLETASLETGGQIGLPLGRIKRVDEVAVRLYKTGSGKVGRADNLEELTIREGGALLGTPTPYFTGDKVVTFPEGYDRDYSIKVVQDKPYPMYVVSIAARGVTYD